MTNPNDGASNGAAGGSDETPTIERTLELPNGALVDVLA